MDLYLGFNNRDTLILRVGAKRRADARRSIKCKWVMSEGPRLDPEEDEAQQEAAWSTWPAGAATGPCGDPDCSNQNCLDPRITRGGTHVGPCIIVSWQTKCGDQFIRVDGETVHLIRPEDIDGVLSTIQAKHDGMGGIALAHHLNPDVHTEIMKP